MKSFEEDLQGGDRRSKGKADAIADSVESQAAFDELFLHIFSDDRVVAMRAADAVEKVTRRFPEFLQTHKETLLDLCHKATNKEMLWHLAAMVPRLLLREPELAQAWDMLSFWARDKSKSRIVRVMSLQSLSDLMHRVPSLHFDYKHLLEELEHEQIPSLKARIRLIRKRLHKAGIF